MLHSKFLIHTPPPCPAFCQPPAACNPVVSNLMSACHTGPVDGANRVDRPRRPVHPACVSPAYRPPRSHSTKPSPSSSQPSPSTPVYLTNCSVKADCPRTVLQFTSSFSRLLPIQDALQPRTKVHSTFHKTGERPSYQNNFVSSHCVLSCPTFITLLRAVWVQWLTSEPLFQGKCKRFLAW